MANVTVTTSNPSITVNETNNSITVSTTTSNVTVGEISPASIPLDIITNSGKFATLSVGNASTTQYTFPTTDGSANQILKTDGNGNLTFVQDDGLVDSVNGQTGVVVLDTDDISEGTNQYYTDAKVDSRLSSGSVSAITISGTNTSADTVTEQVYSAGNVLTLGTTTGSPPGSFRSDVTIVPGTFNGSDSGTRLVVGSDTNAPYLTFLTGHQAESLAVGGRLSVDQSLDLGGRYLYVGADQEDGFSTYNANTQPGNVRINFGLGAIESVNAPDLVNGSVYRISSAGTTDFTTVGSPDNNVNTKFTADLSGGAATGTGVVKGGQIGSILASKKSRTGTNDYSMKMGWVDHTTNFDGGDFIPFSDLADTQSATTFADSVTATSLTATTGDITATTGNIVGSLNTTHIYPTTGNTITVAGSLEVEGNLNVVEKVDLLLQDNKIVMNYGNASARDAFITVDRSGSSLANAEIKWNETDDRFEINPQGGETHLLGKAKVTDKFYLGKMNAPYGASDTYLGTSQIANGAGIFTNDLGLTLNTDQLAGANGGLGIYSNTLTAEVYLLWNETDGRWTFTNDGSTYQNMFVDGDSITGNVITANNFVGPITGNVTAQNVQTTNLTVNTDGFIGSNLSLGGVILPAGNISTGKIKIIGDGTQFSQTNLTGTMPDGLGGEHGAGVETWGSIVFEGQQPTRNQSISASNYSGANAIPKAYFFAATTVKDSSVLTVTGVTEASQWFAGNTSIDSTTTGITAALNNVGTGSIITQEGDMIGTYGLTGLAETNGGLWVASVDSANQQVTMNGVADANITGATNSITDGSHLTFSAGFHDPKTDIRFSIFSDYDLNNGASSQNSMFQGPFLANFNQTGLVSETVWTDFEISAGLSHSDFTLPFNKLWQGRHYWSVRDNPIGSAKYPIFRAKDGIVVGKNTINGNRPYQDSTTSFGINTMWDGLYDSAQGKSNNPVTQNYIAQYKKYSGSDAGANQGPQAGPRLVFTAFDGDVNTPIADQYTKNGYEMGRVMAWSRAQQIANPSTYNPSGKLAWHADDFTGTNTKSEVVLSSTSINSARPRFLTDNNFLQDPSIAAGTSTTHIQGDGAVYLGPAYTGVSAQNKATTEKWLKAGLASGGTGTSVLATSGYDPTLGEETVELGLERNKFFGTFTIRPDRGGEYTQYYSNVAVSNQVFYPTFGGGADSIRFQSNDKYNTIPTTFPTSTPITLDGFTGTFGTAVNGNTYYGQIQFGILLSLYTDSALTTPLQTGYTGQDIGNGTCTYDLSNVSTNTNGKRYSFVIPSTSKDLIFYDDNTTSNTILYKYRSANADFRFEKPITSNATIQGTGFTSTGNIVTDGVIFTDTIDNRTGDNVTISANVVVGQNPSGTVTANVYQNTAITTMVSSVNRGFGGDVIVVSGHSSQTFTDGTYVEISGVVDSGYTQLNGNSYFTKWENNESGYELFQDQSLLTPATDATSGSFNGSPGGSPVVSNVTGTSTQNTFADADLYVNGHTYTANITNTNNITSATFTGNLTGAVTGNLTGDVTGDVTGNLTGDVTGNLTGAVTGTVSDISNHTTADLTEGSNLYYTDARADARVNLQTGTNLDLSNKTTSDLTEGSNLYYTDARVDAHLNSGSVASISAEDTTLKKFNETVLSKGNQSGDISSTLDLDDGSIFQVTATGSITINSLANATAGSSGVIIITQDGTGSRTLTTGSNIKWAGGLNTLSTAANSIDLINYMYDGTTYYFSLTKGYE